MDAQTFQSKYRIDLGATYLMHPMRSGAPLHYHFSDGYSYDVIKRNTSEKELLNMARSIVYLNGHGQEMVKEVLDDLRQLRAGLHNPYKVLRQPEVIQ